ncbi:glycosyltransferase [Gammaproteobacteria bacterium]|nr:glycosyltransferase [Gammaproteobacteria bacterium]
MTDKLIIDLDNTITVDESASAYESKKLNPEVAEAMKNAAQLGMSSTIFSSRNMKTLNGDLKKIEEITRPIAENWLKENHIHYLDLILGKPWCGSAGWYVDDKNLSIEEFIFKYSGPFWEKKVDVIVPFFNEEGNIQKAHYQNKKGERLLNINKYIYVENGSTDNTREKLKEIAAIDSKISLLLLDQNIGYGGALKAGLKNSSSPIIVLNHGDLQFDLYNFISLSVETIKNHGSINILSKRLNRSNIDNMNSAILRGLLSLIFRKKILDFNGQPKIFYKKLLGEIDNLPDNFCIDLAIYLKISDEAIIIPTLQKERNAGTSSWSKSLLKRIKILLEYIFWGIKNK